MSFVKNTDGFVPIPVLINIIIGLSFGAVAISLFAPQVKSIEEGNRHQIAESKVMMLGNSYHRYHRNFNDCPSDPQKLIDKGVRTSIHPDLLNATFNCQPGKLQITLPTFQGQTVNINKTFRDPTNQRLSDAYKFSVQKVPTLKEVLLAGNEAGTSTINMQGNDIKNCPSCGRKIGTNSGNYWSETVSQNIGAFNTETVCANDVSAYRQGGVSLVHPEEGANKEGTKLVADGVTTNGNGNLNCLRVFNQDNDASWTAQVRFTGIVE